MSNLGRRTVTRKRALVLAVVLVLLAALTAQVSASQRSGPTFCGSIGVHGTRLPVVVLRGGTSCAKAANLLTEDLLHGRQRQHGWFCADDTGARLQVGKVEYCRYPAGGGRAKRFVQAYDPDEFNPDQ